MSLDVENYLPVIENAKGYYSKYPINMPVIDTGGQVYNVKGYGATGNGTTDDTTAIQNAINAAGPTGATVLFPAGTYLISSPLTWYKKTATTTQLAPSLQGSLGIGGASIDIGQFGPVKLKASGTFPLGEFLIDYIGSESTSFSSLTGFSIGGFALECVSRAAGIRLCNMESSILKDCVINSARTPNPADTVGSPSGAVSFVKASGANVDNSYNNTVKNVYVYGAGQDGFQLAQSGSSSVVADRCNAISCGRYGFLTTKNTTLLNCDSQTNTSAGYYVQGGLLVGCTTYFANTSNQVRIAHESSGDLVCVEFVGCSFFGNNSDQGSEAANSVIKIDWIETRPTFTACYMKAEGATADWVYIDAGAVTKSSICFDACDFDPNNGALTNVPFNFNGNPNVIVNNCKGINPRITRAKGNVTGATTFTRVDGDHQTATQTGDITVTLTNGLVIGDILTLEIVTGGHAQTWPGNLKLAGGAYAMTGTSTLTIRWDGTNWVEQSRAANIS